MTNFVNNALLHAFEGRDAGCISISAQREGDACVRIAFDDDGIGISEDDQRRIFDPFFTTKLGKGGSGLGLNIVYNIVTNVLGGRIDLSSRLGKGTSFVLTIPLKGPERSRHHEKP